MPGTHDAATVMLMRAHWWRDAPTGATTNNDLCKLDAVNDTTTQTIVTGNKYGKDVGAFVNPV